MSTTPATLIKWAIAITILLVLGNLALDAFWHLNDLIPKTSV